MPSRLPPRMRSGRGASLPLAAAAAAAAVAAEASLGGLRAHVLQATEERVSEQARGRGVHPIQA